MSAFVIQALQRIQHTVPVSRSFPYLCNMIIRLSNLSIGYSHKVPVVSHINIDIKSGALTCLIGNNGIGKSTLLKTLAGFLSPVSGELTIDRQNIQLMSKKELARKISIVLTQRPDVQNFTVEEVVALGRTPYTDFLGNLRAKDKMVVAEALSTIGIEQLRHRMIQTLSDGEFQKTMIAKALAQQTPAILLDEPTAFLDFPSKVETFRLLNQLGRDYDKLILLSTHDMGLALRYADHLMKVDTSGLHLVTSNEVMKDIEQLTIDNKQ